MSRSARRSKRCAKWADQGYTGAEARHAAEAAGIDLQIVKLPEAKKGFVLLPKRWVVEAVSAGWPDSEG